MHTKIPPKTSPCLKNWLNALPLLCFCFTATGLLADDSQPVVDRIVPARIVIAKDAQAGDLLDTVKHTPDAAGSVSFRLTDPAGVPLLSIDPGTGQIRLLKSPADLESESPRTRTITVEIVSQSRPTGDQLSSEFLNYAREKGATENQLMRTRVEQRHFTIVLPEHTPPFQLSDWLPKSPVRFQIPDDITAGSIFGSVRITTGEFRPSLQYRVAAGADQDRFLVTPDGDLQVKSSDMSGLPNVQSIEIPIEVTSRLGDEVSIAVMTAIVDVTHFNKPPLVTMALCGEEWPPRPNQTLALLEIDDEDLKGTSITVHSDLPGIVYDAQANLLVWGAVPESFPEGPTQISVQVRDKEGLSSSASIWLTAPTAPVSPVPPLNTVQTPLVAQLPPPVEMPEPSPEIAVSKTAPVTPESVPSSPSNAESQPLIAGQQEPAQATNSAQAPADNPSPAVSQPAHASGEQTMRIVLGVVLAGLCIALVRIHTLKKELQEEKIWTEKALTDSAQFRLRRAQEAEYARESSKGKVDPGQDLESEDGQPASSAEFEQISDSDDELRNQLADLFSLSFGTNTESQSPSAPSSPQDEASDYGDPGVRPDGQHATPAPFAVEAPSAEFLLPDLEYPVDQPETLLKKSRSVVLDDAQISELRTVANWSARNALKVHQRKQRRTGRVAWSGLAMAATMMIPLNGWLPQDPSMATITTGIIVVVVTWGIYNLGSAFVESIREKALRNV